MYAQHIKACNDLCQSGPEYTRNMLRFVLATIQQQLEAIPMIVEDMRELGADSRFAFGAKAAGLRYLDERGLDLYFEALAVADDPVELMLVFLQVPGLGLVKAGFACQMFAGTVGCLDTHNIKLYGLKASDLTIRKNAKPPTVRKHVERYVELCERLGGAVNLWGNWCEYKAAVSPAGNWPNGAESVSILHVEATNGLFYETLPQFMLFDDRPRYVIAREV